MQHKSNYTHYGLCREQLNTPSTLVARTENQQKRNSAIEIQRKLFGQVIMDQNCCKLTSGDKNHAHQEFVHMKTRLRIKVILDENTR